MGERIAFIPQMNKTALGVLFDAIGNGPGVVISPASRERKRA